MDELQPNEIGRWPRAYLYVLVPSMAAVDKVMAASPTNPRNGLKALRELLSPVAKDGFVVISNAGQKRTIPAKWFAELVYQTRNTELANTRALERFKARGIDTVKVSATNDNGSCVQHAGKVFSISGRHRKYPPLSVLLKTGDVSHIACKAMFVAFIEGLK